MLLKLIMIHGCRYSHSSFQNIQYMWANFLERLITSVSDAGHVYPFYRATFQTWKLLVLHLHYH